MKLNTLSKAVAGACAVLGFAALSSANPVAEHQVVPRATKLTQRAETGITAVAGSWVQWQPGYLSEQRRRSPSSSLTFTNSSQL